MQRLTRTARHVVARGVSADEGDEEGRADVPPMVTAREEEGIEEELELISWTEIVKHSSRDDIWVVVDGTVYDMTEFIKEESGHPGGDAIPLEYAGKDASDFWNDIHGHLLPDLLHEVITGEGDITGLEMFPTPVGLADGPTPVHAMGALTPSTNWAGNVVWRDPDVISPETLEELQTAVREADSLRMLGRSHSFTPMCDTDGVMINMAKMSSVLGLDEVTGRITVEGGMTYTQIMAYLKDTGWALENTASLPHFAIAGALSMGTHGSSGVYQRGREFPGGAVPWMHGENAGDREGVLDGTREDGRAKWGNLGTQCVGVTYVIADGSLVRYTEEEHPEHFSGAVCSLGCLGAMASITLRLVPAFNVKQRKRPATKAPSLTLSVVLIECCLCRTQGCIKWYRWSNSSPGSAKWSPASTPSPPSSTGTPATSASSRSVTSPSRTTSSSLTGQRHTWVVSYRRQGWTRASSPRAPDPGTS